MSRPTDALRDQIAAYLADHHSPWPDAILALVRAHATSDAAVERMAVVLYGDDAKDLAGFEIEKLRAAIIAALGGSS